MAQLNNAASAVGIASGTLPIRYLGLPLTTKSLTSLDYEPLIDKIRSRMLCWSTRSLSFVGRLQHIKSVISGIVNFWMAAFILPAKCLDAIESMCSAFLWSGSPTQTHKAKVSWEDLCHPKEEGGLGIRRLKDSSRVFALHLIWRLFTQNTSLWVCWTRKYLLRYTSFWDVRDDTKGSWIWRKLLKLRDLAFPFLRVDVKNGESVHFWFDNWLGIGRLIDLTGAVGTTYLGLLRRATLRDAVTNGEWSIRGKRSRRFQDLYARIVSTTVPNPEAGSDVVLWRHGEDDYQSCFSARRTWEQIRSKRDKVDWHGVVWSAQGIPRCSFITWLAVRNRLATGDRMRAWGITQGCVFCGEPDEKRDHLFFACPFSFTIWDDMARPMLGARTNPDWHITLTRLQRSRAGCLDLALIKLLFQVVVYTVWRERNARRHGTASSSIDQMKKAIDKLLWNRIVALRYRPDSKFYGLLQRWFHQTG